MLKYSYVYKNINEFIEQGIPIGGEKYVAENIKKIYLDISKTQIWSIIRKSNYIGFWTND